MWWQILEVAIVWEADQSRGDNKHGQGGTMGTGHEGGGRDQWASMTRRGQRCPERETLAAAPDRGGERGSALRTRRAGNGSSHELSGAVADSETPGKGEGRSWSRNSLGRVLWGGGSGMTMLW